jgi:hypothetical protein
MKFVRLSDALAWRAVNGGRKENRQLLRMLWPLSQAKPGELVMRESHNQLSEKGEQENGKVCIVHWY